MKVCVTRPIPQNGISMLKAKGYEVVVNEAAADRAATEEEIIAGVKGVDALLPILTDKVTRAVIEAGLPTLKIIANYGIGFDNVNVEAAKHHHVFVTNTPSDAMTEAVAEHTFALLLNLLRRINEGERLLKAGKYHAWGPTLLLGTGLRGKILGIVGPGRIGSRVGELASAFGMQVRMCGPKDDLDAFLGQCDVISLHVPLMNSTRHLINASRLKKMKPTAFLINTCRGPVIDEETLAVALSKGFIAGAALDVFEHEPEVHPDLLKMENVVLTPHTASATEEVRSKMSETAAQNIIEALEGRTPPNLVQ